MNATQINAAVAALTSKGTFNNSIQEGDFVNWNGQPDNYPGNSTDELNVNKIYRVIYKEAHSYYTKLVIQDTSTGMVFEDGFNELIFTKKEVYHAIAYTNPKEGERYKICVVSMLNGKLNFTSAQTSKVIAKYQESNATWSVITKNSVYSVMVIPETSGSI